MKTYDDYLDEASDQELTPEKIMELAAWMPQMYELADTVADQYGKLQGMERGGATDITFEGDMIEFQWEAYYCGCCGPDTEYMSMPISYLWDKDWQEHAKKEIARKKEERKQREEADKVKRAAAQEAAERKKLEELQAKYGS